MSLLTRDNPQTLLKISLLFNTYPYLSEYINMNEESQQDHKKFEMKGSAISAWMKPSIIQILSVSVRSQTTFSIFIFEIHKAQGRPRYADKLTKTNYNNNNIYNFVLGNAGYCASVWYTFKVKEVDDKWLRTKAGDCVMSTSLES